MQFCEICVKCYLTDIVSLEFSSGNGSESVLGAWNWRISHKG